MLRWPEKDGEKISSIQTNKKIWLNTIKTFDKNIAKKIQDTTTWRESYVDILGKIAALQYSCDEKAVEISKYGLDILYNTFEIEHKNGFITTLQKAIDEFKKQPSKYEKYKTRMFGNGKKTENIIQNIEKFVDENYLLDLIKEDASEKDVLSSFQQVKYIIKNNPEQMKYLQDKYLFIILGSTSELCPLKSLLSWGFSVVGISRPNQERQKQLQDYAIQNPGTLYLPQSQSETITGADIIEDLFSVAFWLISLSRNLKKRIIIGNYIYLDGSKNVLGCLAMDVVGKLLLDQFPTAGVSYLSSYKTSFPFPKHLALKVKQKYDNRSLRDRFLSSLFGDFKPAPVLQIDGDEVEYIFNGYNSQQGVNYALAKTLQNWRMLICAAEERLISCPFVGACSTKSVTRHESVRIGLKGGKILFPIIKLFEPSFARNLMTVLLVYDVINERKRNIRTIWWRNSFHGGNFTFEYDTNSTSYAAYIFGKIFSIKSKL
eukprot:snap_masked-scaffold_19-processed-gene-2.16-mRNA-1 protein AED:1.00 eAED:1.00 QI:0/-1/0/0/-1/1/1/0/487